jgi:hypothetical protein
MKTKSHIRPLHRSPYGEPNTPLEPQRVLVPEDVTAALRSARWRLLMPLTSNMLAFVGGIQLLIPIGGPWLFIGFQLAVLLGTKKWAESIWKCPRCEKPLGRSLTPPSCPHCGQPYQSSV